MPDARVILIGLRGSGKTTVARAIDPAAVDLDDLTPGLLHAADAAEAIRVHGLPAFRAAEARALAEALQGPARVLALGGGTPTAPGAAALLQAQQAVLVYLRGTPATLANRLAATDLRSRPSLTGRGVLDEIDAVFAERDPLYRRLATRTIDIDGLSVGQTVAAVLDAAGLARPPR